MLQFSVERQRKDIVQIQENREIADSEASHLVISKIAQRNSVYVKEKHVGLVKCFSQFNHDANLVKTRNKSSIFKSLTKARKG